jgi:O-antigen ligase
MPAFIEALASSAVTRPLFILLSLFFMLRYNSRGEFIYFFAAFLPIALLLITHRNTEHSPPLPSLEKPVWLFAALALWLNFSPLWSEIPISSIETVLVFNTALLAALLASRLNNSEVSRLFTLIFVAAAALSLLTLWQVLQQGAQRPTGMLLNWNSHAALLNLAIIPLCWRYLNDTNARAYSGPLLALLVCSLALTQSRGALLGLAVALLLLLPPLYQTSQRSNYYRPFIIMGLWMVCGYTVATLINDGIGAARLLQGLSGADPVMSGRFEIWHATFNAYLDRPWLGWGLGTYWGFYPLYRMPIENSAGTFAHNDYLQILAESGPVGLLLLLMLALWPLLRYLQEAKGGRINGGNAPVIAAISATLLHSVFTFNLYNAAILLLLGFYWGLVSRTEQTNTMITSSPDFFRALPGITLLYTLLTLTLITIQEWFIYDSLNRTTALEAVEELDQASAIFPWNDIPHLWVAQNVVNAITQTPADDTEQRLQLAHYGLDHIDTALQYHPFRIQSYLTRIEIKQLVPSHFSWREAASDYQEALDINPANLALRVTYADYLQSQNEPSIALEVLEAGWGRSCYISCGIVEKYLNDLISLRQRLGDASGVNEAQKVLDRFTTKRMNERSVLGFIIR